MGQRPDRQNQKDQNHVTDRGAGQKLRKAEVQPCSAGIEHPTVTDSIEAHLPTSHESNELSTLSRRVHFLLRRMNLHVSHAPKRQSRKCRASVMDNRKDPSLTGPDAG